MRAYESTNGRYVDLDRQPRKRTKHCPQDDVALTERAGWLFCPSCGWTADELAQVTR